MTVFDPEVHEVDEEEFENEEDDEAEEEEYENDSYIYEINEEDRIPQTRLTFGPSMGTRTLSWFCY